MVPRSINHLPRLLAVPGGCPSPHLLLFLLSKKILLRQEKDSRIFLLSVSRNTPWTCHLLLLFLLFPCVLSFPAFSGRRALLLYFPRCSLPCTLLSSAPTTVVPTLADSSSVCSLLLSALLLPAKFLPVNWLATRETTYLSCYTRGRHYQLDSVLISTNASLASLMKSFF